MTGKRIVVSPSRQAPDLVLGEIKTRLRHLDASGWFEELTELYRLSVIHKLGLHKNHPAICIMGSGDETKIGVVPFSTVQFLGPHRSDFQPAKEQLPALFVGLDAPDAVILRQMKLTLKAARNHFQYLEPAVKKNGQFALNHRFDESTFRVWRKNKIVQFGRLLVWRATLSAAEAKDYPNHALGKIIGLDDDRATSEVKAKLKKALASLPALLTQIADEMTGDRVAEELIAARIKKEPKHRD